MTITEDLCKTLGVNINVPFILTCNSKVIIRSLKKMYLLLDVILVVGNRCYIKMFYTL